MSITAVVTNHNYERYLRQCFDTALKFCDEVLVYDDGSTDGSMDVITEYGIKFKRRIRASGTPVWGSNCGIEDATCDHLIFLDADNYLIAPPPITDADYTFAPISVVNDLGNERCRWSYDTWPTTAEECWRWFVGTSGMGTPQMPFPWGGVWRTEFIKPLRWRAWETTGFAADMRTALDWCKHNPTLAYSPTPFLAFRKHAGQWSASPEREVMYAEAMRVAESETFAE